MDERRQAAKGREQIEKAIKALLEAEPGGLKNADVSRRLGLRCDSQDGQRNWITWTVLRDLVTQKVVERRGQIYRLASGTKR